MVQDTLKIILEAEAQAEDILKGALEEAKLTVQHADEEAEKIRSEAKEKVKAERKSVVLHANKDSEEEFLKIIKEGQNASDKLEKETDTLEAAKFIRDAIFDNYGI